MTRKSLTPEQWSQVFTLPADGVSYNLPGIAFRAKHLPQTKMYCEQVICETQYGVLRRIRMGADKWRATDYIPSY